MRCSLRRARAFRQMLLPGDCGVGGGSGNHSRARVASGHVRGERQLCSRDDDLATARIAGGASGCRRRAVHAGGPSVGDAGHGGCAARCAELGLFAKCCSPVIVVLGAGAETIRARASRPATFVVNANYARGMTTSLQRGLQAVPPDAEGVLFTLVDHPSVTPATVDALLAAPSSGFSPNAAPR